MANPKVREVLMDELVEPGDMITYADSGEIKLRDVGSSMHGALRGDMTYDVYRPLNEDD